MAQAPAIGSRWIRRNGRLEGAEIEVTETNGLSVYFINRNGSGVAMGNQKADDSKPYSLAYETFMAQYVSRDSLPSGTPGGTAFRQRNLPKPKGEPSQIPLTFNAIGLGDGAPLHVEIVEITPSMAEAWLARGGNNRVPTRMRILRLANAIRRGEWRLTGDSIKLDNEGHVRDGRHRLLAIIEAGMPIRSLVVRGVGEEDFTVFDTGKSRTPGDVMGIAGYENRVAIASVARALILIENTGRYDPPNRKEIDALLSHTNMLHYVQGHPEVEAGVLMANHIRSAGLSGGAGLLGTLCALLIRADNLAAQDFTEALTSGANLETDSPILRFRNRLITDKRMSNALADREHLLALGIKAWNAWRSGETIKQLTFHPNQGLGRRAGEPFPVPI